VKYLPRTYAKSDYDHSKLKFAFRRLPTGDQALANAGAVRILHSTSVPDSGIHCFCAVSMLLLRFTLQFAMLVFD